MCLTGAILETALIERSTDVDAAKGEGFDPGGMIMIYGQPRGYGWWSWLMQMFDWRNGCIGVTDEKIAEIWQMVKSGTTVEINP